jgi:hypothetical protein
MCSLSNSRNSSKASGSSGGNSIFGTAELGFSMVLDMIKEDTVLSLNRITWVVCEHGSNAAFDTVSSPSCSIFFGKNHETASLAVKESTLS